MANQTGRPQEEQDIREFLTAVHREVEIGVTMGRKITLKWLFEQLVTEGVLDQSRIFEIHDALTKVCQHDMHNHYGSSCYICGQLGN